MKFPRQLNKQGGWTIQPEYLEQVREMIEQSYDELPDAEPSWEQIEMVLLAVEKMMNTD